MRSSGTGSGPAPTSPGGGVRLAARRGTDHTPRYPELAAIAEALGGREAILDGEIVAFDESGKPSFQLLQRRMGLTTESTIRLRASETPATYVAFDLLWLDGRSLLAEPYERRRELLAELEFDGPSWQAPAHHVGDGQRLWEAVAEAGPRGDRRQAARSPYRPGQRSREWLKVRHRRGQELVIGGWMPGEGSRGGRVGSLLVGHWDATPEEAERLGRPQRLVYAGGVGTGYTQEMLDRLTALLEPLRRRTRRSSSARTRRSSTASGPATAAPARCGSSRSSSASSSSPSGPTRAPCASRPSRACATTRTRARSSGSPEDSRRRRRCEAVRRYRRTPAARAARAGSE